MDSKKKPEKHLPKDFEKVLAGYLTKISQSNLKNTSEVYQFSASYFGNKLTKTQNKLAESAGQVRNIDVQYCKPHDITESGSKETKEDASVEKSPPVITEEHGKDHLPSSSPVSEACEECNKQRCWRGDEIPGSQQVQNVFKLAMLSAVRRKMPRTAMMDEGKKTSENFEFRIIPKVSKDSSQSPWYTEQTETENSETKPPFKKAILGTNNPNRSTKLKNVHKLNQSERLQEVESFGYDDFFQKPTKKVDTNCSSKVERTKMDKYYVVRKNTPQPDTSESTLSLEDALGANSPICQMRQWPNGHQREMDNTAPVTERHRDDVNEDGITCIREWYTSWQLRQTELRNSCRQKCRETLTEMRQVPDRIICRVKYTNAEPSQKTIDFWEYLLPDY